LGMGKSEMRSGGDFVPTWLGFSQGKDTIQHD
jgi:hypothetical protein